jgi:hypothetical protein
METITIDIINPKARKLINDLADMELIKITEKSALKKLLERTRRFSDEAPPLEVITEEVEIVRQQMYDERKNNH